MSHEFEPPVAAVVATLNQKLHKAISDWSQNFKTT